MKTTAWPGLELVRPLAGGARNQVWLARRGTDRLVVRRSGRPPRSTGSWTCSPFVPDGVDVPSPVDRNMLATAGLAWETATCWAPEPAYAARCLAELYRSVDLSP